MQTRCLLFLAGVLACLGAACQQAPKQEAPTSDYMTTTSIREIMDAMVMPPADVLWNSVSTSVTEKGVEQNGPKTDEDWLKLRRQTVTLVEATNLILMPGRHVAKAGDKAKDANSLEPEQIDALISKDPAKWAQFTHKLHDAGMVVMKAIDDKSLTGLEDAGGGLDAACEDCHKVYWYPDQGQAAAPANSTPAEPEAEKK